MSTEQESLSEIIGKPAFAPTAKAEPAKGEPEKAAAPPAAEKPEVTAEGKTRDESGRFAKTEEKAEKPAEKPAEAKPRADVAAIIDERRKRQEAERRYADLLAQQQKSPEKPSVFENEDAAISSRIAEGNQPLREAIYKLSVKSARALYKDFGDAEQAFLEAMDKDERLIHGLRASDDPGEFIYTMGIHVRELADVGGDLMKYRDKVTAASQAQLTERDAQIKALTAEIDTLKKAQVDLDEVPRSLNQQTSSAAPKAGSNDPENIRSIVRFGNNPT